MASRQARGRLDAPCRPFAAPQEPILDKPTCVAFFNCQFDSRGGQTEAAGYSGHGYPNRVRASLVLGSPLVEHASEVVVGSVVGHGLGIQGPVDSWFSSLHSQTIQLHCGCYTAWRWKEYGFLDASMGLLCTFVLK